MNVAECKNSKKYCHESIGIGIGNTFQKQYYKITAFMVMHIHLNISIKT